MTSKQLNKLVALWQKRLRIQDWDITVSVVSEAQMHQNGYDDAWGVCFVEQFKKRADIKISVEVIDADGPDTFESVLVHELLHVMMPGRDLGVNIEKPESAEYVCYERLVDQMSHILVEAFDGHD